MGLTMYVLLFLISLAVLLYASDRFVDSAENIGLSLGVPTFIIGVTIVAFGTSLPEMATSIAAVYSGASEIVIGSVIGSNVTNILLIIGLTAFVGKVIKLDFDVWDVDMPILYTSAFLMYFVLRDLHISFFETGLFLTALMIFLLNSFKGEKEEKHLRRKSSWVDYAMLLGAGVLVYFSANYTIVALKEIAGALSVPPHIIALTVIALGTSLPELIVSLAAARKGKHAMAVGNVLGSNIFNTYAVLGVSSLFGDIVVPDSVTSFDMPFMIVVTILFGMMCLGGRISKWEGATLLVLYFYFIGESIKSVL